MLEQCKLKAEDFEKIKKDQLQAEVLERKKKISRMTIRSKAAKTIEKISGKPNYSNNSMFRQISNGCLLRLKKSA